MLTKKRLPENYTELFGDAVISNFEGVIDHEVAEHLKDQMLYSRYSGWHFNGIVWYENGLWYCELWHMGSYQYTLLADTLEEIQEDVTSVFGVE